MRDIFGGVHSLVPWENHILCYYPADSYMSNNGNCYISEATWKDTVQKRD